MLTGPAHHADRRQRAARPRNLSFTERAVVMTDDIRRYAYDGKISQRNFGGHEYPRLAMSATGPGWR
jgi:hypothetical protein